MTEPLRSLLIRGTHAQYWHGPFQDVLMSLGEVELADSTVLQLPQRLEGYALLILDAAAVADVEPWLRQIKDWHPELPIIVVTSSPTWTRARAALRAGAVDYVRPLGIADIQQAVTAAIQSNSRL